MINFVEKLKKNYFSSVFFEIVNEFFNLVSTNSNEYKVWKNYFLELHGDLNSQRKHDLSLVKKKYNLNIENNNDFFKFIYSLQISYIILLKKIAEKKISLLDKKIKILNFNIDSRYSVSLTSERLKNFFLILDKEISNFDFSNNKIDNVKNIYENLFPKSMRHSIGEFYTPDWLTKIILSDFIKKKINLKKKFFLDPTCGAGTFLFNVYDQYKNEGVKLNNICGFDINPLAIFAAKTNYILLLPKNFSSKELVIPFFNFDCTQIEDYFSNKNLKNKKFNPNQINKKYKELINNKKNLDIDKEFSNLKNFDYVIGNPPMVNWEYLPKRFKDRTVKIWQKYQLFDYKGMKSIFIKEDISALITYISADKYLKDDGYLSFILKESLFKSLKQAAGFRNFFYFDDKKRIDLQPYKINDFTKLKPFEKVNVNVVSANIRKNKKIKFPIDYFIWKKNQSDNYEIEKKVALPLIKNQNNSNWLIVNKDQIKSTYKFLGKGNYKARTGVFCGGANAIYYIKILKKKNNLFLVQNINERAKNKFEEVNKFIENDLVYPIIYGRNIKQWGYTNSNNYIVFPHTVETKMYPITHNQLKKFQFTFDYLNHFKSNLKSRKGFTSFDKHIQNEYFYSLQRVGAYTFSNYKVAWKYIATEFTTCVISKAKDEFLNNKIIVPNEKVIFIPFENKDEAYFVCGFLSSTLIRELINSFISKIQISPSTIENINIPKFDIKNKLHLEISSLCEQGHYTNDCNKKTFLKKIDKIIENLN